MLQKQLDKGPFVDYAGKLVRLGPQMRGNGLMCLVFDQPELICDLVPTFYDATPVGAWGYRNVDTSVLTHIVNWMDDHEIGDEAVAV